MNLSSRFGEKRKTNGILIAKRYIFLIFHFNGYLFSLEAYTKLLKPSITVL